MAPGPQSERRKKKEAERREKKLDAKVSDAEADVLTQSRFNIIKALTGDEKMSLELATMNRAQRRRAGMKI